MHFLFRRTQYHRQRQQWRTLFNDTALPINHVRDRGLDHVVEREKNLKPLLQIKNLIKSEPSKTIPLNVITQSKDSLQIPIRPIEFIRKYPSIFQEFFPAGINIHPHIKLSQESLSLDEDEELFYQSVSYKQDVADRVLKLLMIGKVTKIPLCVLDKLKWDLGLCDSFVKSVVPEFPDYFQVSGSESVLELVCWSHELAVSFMQKEVMKCEENNEDLLVKFALKYSNGFEVDKKYKKWVDEWQKLPYISPYENVKNLPAKSDEADKWAVIILHEILSLCVGKKAEKDSLLLIGECLGLRSRFKKALMLHPGIFYVSSKNGIHTVVLKEGYKRGMLIQRNPLMELRYKYVHLMNKVMEDKKSKDMQQKSSKDVKEGDAKETDDDMEEEEAEEDDDEDDEDSDDVHNDYNDDEAENEARDVKHSQRLNLRTSVDDRKPSQRLNSRTRDDDRKPNRRLNSRTRDDDRKTSATSPMTFSGRNSNRDVERKSRRPSRRAENNSEQDGRTRYEDRRSSNRDTERTSRRSSWRAENNGGQDARTRYEDRRSSNRDMERTSRRSPWRAENNGEQDARTRYVDRKLPINSAKTWAGRSSNGDKERTSRSSRRPETNDNQYAHRRSSNKLDPRRNRGTSEQRRTSTP
ncbi:protein ROOT PRIMORDIUM DEFECTIVE 1 [Lycium barbarum]|uniref:protein ROOT PRIMORDIUM DEFECTIVE 1 n=1 Tax=Lycium barbarum TaxID=112863 RepID=UPI00293F59C8|nr:protein ROOT PRIMORDIUM DEFECTIVE 1 [Lycium barbarum]XP_060198198.1 protein ROOT PRIMORDIUM DEFECTIVE 1 [Lycium barbarum]XP_060198199.1 protein ROOT PRIMORDIUM DEFECTIVE 1 [Lycium barbarum]